MEEYKRFLLTCINNRKLLEYSEKEMASYLENVSEQDYIKFENGKYLMSENNMKKIIRILAVKSIETFNLSDYIEIKGLSEEEIDDLSVVVAQIVGEDNDWFK